MYIPYLPCGLRLLDDRSIYNVLDNSQRKEISVTVIVFFSFSKPSVFLCLRIRFICSKPLEVFPFFQKKLVLLKQCLNVHFNSRLVGLGVTAL